MGGGFRGKGEGGKNTKRRGGGISRELPSRPPPYTHTLPPPSPCSRTQGFAARAAGRERLVYDTGRSVGGVGWVGWVEGAFLTAPGLSLLASSQSSTPVRRSCPPPTTTTAHPSTQADPVSAPPDTAAADTVKAQLSAHQQRRSRRLPAPLLSPAPPPPSQRLRCTAHTPSARAAAARGDGRERGPAAGWRGRGWRPAAPGTTRTEPAPTTPPVADEAGHGPPARRRQRSGWGGVRGSKGG